MEYGLYRYLLNACTFLHTLPVRVTYNNFIALFRFRLEYPYGTMCKTVRCMNGMVGTGTGTVLIVCAGVSSNVRM